MKDRGRIKITPIQTGTVDIKRRQAFGLPGRSGAGRKLDMLRDTQWISGLPILCWLIEHPDGLYLVDTGEAAQASLPSYTPAWSPLRQLVRMRIAPDEEIGPQLRDLGVRPKDLTAVILTHCHTDHAGGIHHFPHTPIWAAPAGYLAARSILGRVTGSPAPHWPLWFAPRPLEFSGPAFGPFAASEAITPDGTIMAVPTPGHAPGHLSVIIRDAGADLTYLLAGDVTYNQDHLIAGVVDGITNDPDLSLSSMQRVLAFAQQQPTVVLPSHDPDAPMRLAARAVLPAQSGART